MLTTHHITAPPPQLPVILELDLDLELEHDSSHTSLDVATTRHDNPQDGGSEASSGESTSSSSLRAQQTEEGVGDDYFISLDDSALTQSATKRRPSRGAGR